MNKVIYLLVLIFGLHFTPLSSQTSSTNLDSLILVRQNDDSEENRINALIEIGRIQRTQSNADTAITIFRQSIEEIGVNDFAMLRAKAYISMASAFIVKTSFDSSEHYFGKAEMLLPEFDDYLVESSFYGDRAVLFFYQGDFVQASDDFAYCLGLAKAEKNTTNIIRYSNNTALVKTRLGQTEEAINIYFDALTVAQEVRDTLQEGKLLNNIGLLFEGMTEYEEALKYYEDALTVKHTKGSQVDIANGTYNVGNVKLLLLKELGDSSLLQSAQTNFESLLDLSTEIDYGTGVLFAYEGVGKVNRVLGDIVNAKTAFETMASKARMAKDVKSEGIALLNIGSIEIDSGNAGEGIKKLLDVEEVITSKGDPVHKIELYNYLADYHEGVGDYKSSYAALKSKIEIEKQLSTTILKDKLSRYKVKFETERTENQLNETRAVLLQSQLEVKQKNEMFYGASALAIIFGLLGYLFYNNQRIKNTKIQKEKELQLAVSKIESQNQLNEQRLRISRDLHDNIGAQLTFVISSLDNLKYGFDLKDKVNEKIEGISGFTQSTIGELRDTIWAMNKDDISMDDLKSRIHNFIDKAELADDQIKFDCIIDSHLSGVTLTSVIGMNIYRIIQESVNNAIKYARPNHILVTLDRAANRLNVKIADDGIGFNLDQVERGSGLTNMEKRARDISAKLELESEEGQGSTVRLAVPLA